MKTLSQTPQWSSWSTRLSNSMAKILVSPMQCQVHSTVVNECHNLLSFLPSKDNHALLVHDHDGCSQPLTIPLSLDGVTSYLKTRPSPSTISHPKAHHGIPWLPCILLRRMAQLITGDTLLPSVPQTLTSQTKLWAQLSLLITQSLTSLTMTILLES